MAPTTVDNDTIRANWRCFVACGFMLVTPFQYGLDFGLIGGLQAMRGFLQVHDLPHVRGDRKQERAG